MNSTEAQMMPSNPVAPKQESELVVIHKLAEELFERAHEVCESQTDLLARLRGAQPSAVGTTEKQEIPEGLLTEIVFQLRACRSKLQRAESQQQELYNHL